MAKTLPPESSSATLDQRWRRSLDRILKQRRIRYIRLSKQINYHRSWLSRLLSGESLLRVDHLDMILTAIGMSEAEFLQIRLGEIGDQPARAAWEHRPELALETLQGSRSVLPEIVTRFQLLSTSPLHGEDQIDLDPRVEIIDRLRESDWELARAKAEQWLQDLYTAGYEEKHLGKRETAQLCSALGVWASLHRVKGRVTLAARTLEVAIELHGDARASLTHADLLERTGSCLLSAGYPYPALAAFHSSLAGYTLAGVPSLIAKGCLGIGLAYRLLGYHSIAATAFLRCLHLQGCKLIYRLAARINLANCYESLGEPAKAVEALATALPFALDLPARIRISGLGSHARHLALAGRLRESALIFEELLVNYRQHMGPVEQFTLFFDYAEILIRLPDRQKLAEAIPLLLPASANLENLPRCHAIAAGFLQYLKHDGELGVSVVAKARREFSQASSKVGQPMGSASG